MKPLYYFLAQHGPWDLHVEIKGHVKYMEALDHMINIGKKENVDFEIINYEVQTKKSNQPKHTHIILFRDRSLFTQIKMMFG